MSITMPARTAETVRPSEVITDLCTSKLADRIPVAGAIADLLVSGTSLVMYQPEQPGKDEFTQSMRIDCGGIPGSPDEEYTIQIGWSLTHGAGVVLESYVASPDVLTDGTTGMPCSDPELVLDRIQAAADAASGLIVALSK